MMFNVVASLLLCIAGFVTLSNWVFLAQNNRNDRLGNGRRVSMVFVVPQIVTVLAWLTSPQAEQAWVPGKFYLLVAVGDPSFLLLCAWPFVLLWRRYRSGRSAP